MFDNFNAFIQNPLAFFNRSKFNIPQDMKNPEDVINYLLQSGQLSQDQYNQVYSQYRNLQGNGGLPPFVK